MLKKYKLTNGRLIESLENQAELYVYIAPDEKEKLSLTSEFKIDEHTLNSSLDPDELGRVEFETDHLATIVKRPKKYCANDNFVFKIASIGLFLYADKLIVVLNEEDLLWEIRVLNRMN